MFKYFSIITAHGNGPMKCIQCSSKFNSKNECIENPNSPNLKYCQATTGDCYTVTYEDQMNRGCIGDIIVPHRNMCKQTKYENCTICTNKDLCNDGLTENCYSDFENNGKLVSIQCSLSKNKPMGCYERKDANAGQRYGCVSHLSDDERKQCDDNKSCSICNENNCNEASRTCYICNSKDDVDCVETNSRTWKDSCKPTQLNCVTGIGVNGITYRRCTNTNLQDSAEFAVMMNTCETNNCNSEVIPDNRRKCLIRRDFVSKDELQYCKFYKKDDKCYSLSAGMNLLRNFFFFFLDCIMLILLKLEQFQDKKWFVVV